MIVRQRETYTAEQWHPGTPVAGVRLYRDNGTENYRYMLLSWPGGSGLCSISPGDWVLTAKNGFRFNYDDALFRRIFAAEEAAQEPTDAREG